MHAHLVGFGAIAGTIDFKALESSELLVDAGIEAAYKTDLGKRLKEVGASVATGAALGASIGTAFPVIGNVVGAVVGTIAGAIAGVVPWLVSILNPCEFMVYGGEGGVSCEEFPARVEAAIRFVQEYPEQAVYMTPEEFALKFGIFRNRADAEIGMGGDATPLMSLPEAQEILRTVQVPMASALMTTVPPSLFNQTLQSFGQNFPAMKLEDVKTIAARVVKAQAEGPSAWRGGPPPAPAPSPLAHPSSQWSTAKKWWVGTLTVAAVGTAGLYGYAYWTRQPVKRVVRQIGRKTKRLFA